MILNNMNTEEIKMGFCDGTRQACANGCEVVILKHLYLMYF